MLYKLAVAACTLVIAHPVVAAPSVRDLPAGFCVTGLDDSALLGLLSSVLDVPISTTCRIGTICDPIASVDQIEIGVSPDIRRYC